MIFRAVALCFLLSGCAISAGVAFHPEGYDYPNTDMSRGLGIVRGEAQLKGTNITGFCEHISGLNTDERSPLGGLNMCGGMIRIY